MIAFVVATPLQLFNCVNLMTQSFPFEKADIFVMDFNVKRMGDYAGCIKHSKYFEDVYVLNDLKKHEGKLGVFRDYYISDKHVFHKKKYDVLFTTWVGDRSSLIFNELQKDNPQIRLYYYEEGTGIYCKNVCDYGSLMPKFYKLFGIKYDADYLKAIYAYAPEYIYDKRYQKREIPKIDKTNRTIRENIESIFSRYNIIPYDEKLIFLENFFYKDKNDDRYECFKDINQVALIDSLSHHCKKEDILVRKHPITTHNEYENAGFKIDSNDAPWELILYHEDFSNKILVSVVSTAVFSPKLIFDDEPYIVILAKAYSKVLNHNASDFVYSDSFEQLVHRLKKLYKRPERVIVPETFEEFFDSIDTLMRRQ